MTLKVIASITVLLFGLPGAGRSQNAQAGTDAPRMIIRTDDIGFCHGVNMAFKRVAQLRIPGAVGQ